MDQKTKTQVGQATPAKKKPPSSQTATEAPPEPPKKPPSSQTATEAPPEPPKKPPSGIDITSAEPDRFPGRSAAQKIINRRLSAISDKDLIAAFKADPFSVLKKFNYFTSPQHQYRLNQLIKKNPRFKPFFEQTLSRLKPPPLTQVKPTPTTKAKPKAPPQITPEDLVKPLPKTNEINNTNKGAIQRWLNQLKPEFQAYLAKKQKQQVAQAGYKAVSREYAAKQAEQFTRHLWSFLSLYRGRIVGHYLSEASYSLIFSALGPIGNMMNLAYNENYSWKMAWQKNLLNPNVIHYYFNSLPTQKAFDVLKYPLSAGWSILAKGGAPLISTVHYKDYKFDHEKGFIPEIKKKNVFTPLLATIQASNALGNKVYQEKDPQHFHQLFDKSLKKLELAKKQKDLKKTKLVQHQIDQLLNIYSGSLTGSVKQNFLDISSGLRRHLKNNLKSSDRRDPISFLVILLAQLVFDFAIGLALNTLRLVATRLISLVPGVNALRAKIANFLTSRPWLENMRFAGATGPAFVRGVFSFNTLSSGYLGYQLGGPVLAPITGGLGALYKTSLILSKNKALITWVKNFENLQGLAKSPTAARMWALDEMAKLYGEWRPGKWKLGGWTLKPGPLTRFASFLSKNWWFRLPLNGLAIGHLFSPFFKEVFGWSPLQSTLALAGADYFWQIKGNLGRALMKAWIKPSWKIFGRTWATPHWKLFSLSNPHSVFSKVYSRYIQTAWRKIAKNLVMFPHEGLYWADKPWLKTFKNMLGRTQPYLQNFFNPGLLLGFGLGPWLASFGVPWWPAHFAGALIGTATWWSVGLLYDLAARGIKGAMTFAQLTASAWTGYWIGLGLQAVLGLFGFSAPWLPLVTTLISVAFPILATFATSAGLLGAIGSFAQGILTALSLLAPLGALLGTLFFYLAVGTVVVGVFYVVFVLISSLWNPSGPSGAIGASECFEIEVTADKTIVNPGDLVTTCATYTVIPDPLLLHYPYLTLTVTADFLKTWDYHNYIKDKGLGPQDGVQAWRQRPSQSMQPLLNPWDLDSCVASHNNCFFISIYPAFYPNGYGGNFMKILLSVLGNDDPDTGYHYSGKTIAELAQDFPSLGDVPITTTDKQRQIDILKAKVKTAKHQLEVLNTLLSNLNFVLTSLNQPDPNNISSELQAFRENFLTLFDIDNNDSSHPFYDQIQDAQTQLASCGSDQDCRNHFKQLINTYDGWERNISNIALPIQSLILRTTDAETTNPDNPDYSKVKPDFETLVNTTIPARLDDLEDAQAGFESAIDQLNDFDLSKEYYYAEGNTVYKVCWQAYFRGAAGETSYQTAEISFSQPGGLITQYSCQTQNTVIFNP